MIFFPCIFTWQSVGKTTVTCTDTPGFVVNRLLVPYLSESIRLLERGVATPEDIDNAMKLGMLLVLRSNLTSQERVILWDLSLCAISLDSTRLSLFSMVGVRYFGNSPISCFIHFLQAHPEEQTFQPIPLLNKLVAEGKLGKKSGEGFYKY